MAICIHCFLGALVLLTSPNPYLSASAAPAPNRVAEADTLRYTVLKGADSTGTLWVARRARQRTLRTYITFNDRGRGSELTSDIVLGDDGFPVRMETHGHDYFKAPVAEEYSWNGETARWQSAAEHGAEPTDMPRFYVSLHGSPFESALLTHALMAAPKQRLELLPYGEARLRKLRTAVVEAPGKRKAVTLYAIDGLDSTPTYVWLDEQGAFFGASYGWFGVIASGWEEALPTLKETQEAATLEQLERLAQELPRRPEQPVVFHNARLFESETGRVREGITVVIEGERITAVGLTDEVALPEGAEVIDASGKTLLPGLFDMHVHASPEDGLLHLAGGVTTVRDLGNTVEDVLETRERFARGDVMGPRMVIAGFIDRKGLFAAPTGTLVSSEEEALEAIEKYADLGFSQIKLYNSLDTAWVPAMIKAAHARGLRVSGHIPVHLTAEEAVRMGLDEIHHVNFLVLNFLPDTLDTRTSVRFHAPGAHAAGLDLRSDQITRFVELLRERDVVVDPTVTFFELLYMSRPGEPAPSFAQVRDQFPVQQRRLYESGAGGLRAPEGMEETYRASYRQMLALVHRLHEAGVRIVAGTDTGPVGFALHRELELYEEAGIPAPEVLRIATWTAAGVAGLRDELGSIEEGKLADLILVKGHPAMQISDIRNVEFVMKGGVLYDPDKLYRAYGYAPRRAPC